MVEADGAFVESVAARVRVRHHDYCDTARMHHGPAAHVAVIPDIHEVEAQYLLPPPGATVRVGDSQIDVSDPVDLRKPHTPCCRTQPADARRRGGLERRTLPIGALARPLENG